MEILTEPVKKYVDSDIKFKVKLPSYQTRNVTGTFIDETDTIEDGKTLITYKGNTSQTQYEGYNLLDVANASISTEKATYTTNETGYTITTNSQADATHYGRIVIQTPYVNSSDNFAFSFDITSNTAGYVIGGWVGANKYLYYNINANTKTRLYASYSGISTTAFSLGIYQANSTLKIENIQIYKGNTQKDYEPYVRWSSKP